MRKLEIKDIAGYLPYELKVMRPDNKTVLSVIGFYANGTVMFDENNITCGSLQNCKPILRPMSDIAKPIIVKGYNDDKEFVPIVELAKAEIGGDKYRTLATFSFEIGTLNGDVCLRYTPYLLEGIYEFMYINGSFSKRYKGAECLVSNHALFFDLLNQWNFDYRGLIDAGLAININTLNK